MPSLESVLANIPGLAGYEAQNQLNRQKELGALQQAGGAMSLMDVLRKNQQQQAYQQAVAGLGENPTQEQLVGVSSRFASPDKLMDVQQKSLDRQAASSASLMAAQERIAAQMEIAKQRGADQRTLMEMQMAGRKELAQLAASMKQQAQPYFSPYDSSSGAMKFDHRSGEFTPALDGKGNPIRKSASDPALQGDIAAAKKEGSEIGGQRSMLVGKENALESVRSASALLEKGIYTGFYGPAIKTAVKATPGVDKDKAARTEQFLSDIGNVVIPRLKEFGGNDSNEEMRYLQRVMGGDISMEDAALKKVVKDAEVKIQRGINRLKQGGSTYAAPPAKGVITVTSQEQALKLPSGTKFNLNGRVGTVQ